MKLGSSWIWLTILSIINLGLSAYYGVQAVLVLCIAYGVFGAFWGITAYFQFTKQSNNVNQFSKVAANTEPKNTISQSKIKSKKKRKQK